MPVPLPIASDGATANAFRKPDLILHNCRVFAYGASVPERTLVSVVGETIQWVGDEIDLAQLRGPGTRVVDCQGKRLVPGFIDAHMHLFAYAANLRAVDCRPSVVRSIADIQARLRERAHETPHGQWIRAWGYDEWGLAEERHPTRWELDEAAPNHPVKLTHRTGHACVLNTVALDRLRISGETSEPPGAVIGRDAETGEITGYLMEMEEQLAAADSSTLAAGELDGALAEALRQLASRGVTSLHEATPTNALGQWDVLDGLRQNDRLPVRVHKMFSPGDLAGVAERGLGYGDGSPMLSVGPVKIMLNETGATVLPSLEEVVPKAYEAHALGYQVAFHAVEEAGIRAAADIVEGVLERSASDAANIAVYGLRLLDHRHRIEHCGVCPPELAQRLRSLGIVVVTQPGFLSEHGDRYLRQVPAERQKWLHPIAGLHDRGLKLAIGSDAPVASPEPLRSIAASVSRRSSAGAEVNATEAISADLAIYLHTWGGAYATADEHLKGSIVPGQLADLALLSEDPLRLEAEAIGDVRVEMTVVGGRIVWER